MRKLAVKPIAFLLALVLFLAASALAQKNAWQSKLCLNCQGTTNCNLGGSNSIHQFNKLCNAVFGINTPKVGKLSVTGCSNKVAEITLCNTIGNVTKTTQTIYCTITDCD